MIYVVGLVTGLLIGMAFQESLVRLRSKEDEPELSLPQRCDRIASDLKAVFKGGYFPVVVYFAKNKDEDAE